MKNLVTYKKNVYTFNLALSRFQRRKFMAFRLNKNKKQFTSSRILCPTKICFVRYHHPFCGKLEAVVHSCFVENLFFSKSLKIFKKIQVVDSDFSKFSQSAAIVKIDVLLGKIFHNLQTNNYMTSPVSISLNILRTCEKCQVAFYYCTDSILVVTYTSHKDVL